MTNCCNYYLKKRLTLLKEPNKSQFIRKKENFSKDTSPFPYDLYEFAQRPRFVVGGTCCSGRKPLSNLRISPKSHFLQLNQMWFHQANTSSAGVGLYIFSNDVSTFTLYWNELNEKFNTHIQIYVHTYRYTQN